MKNCGLILISVFITVSIAAQVKPAKNNYYLLPQIALLNGDQSASGQVQVAGGIEKNGWGIGIGTGIDYYKVRTVPVFVDLRKSFGNNGAVFSYCNIGSTLAWPLESQYSYDYIRGWSGSGRRSDFSNGLYTDVGIGYSIRGKKNKGIALSLGYSMKQTTETRYGTIYMDFPPYVSVNTETKLDYTFNRIAFRLGVRL